MNNYVPLDTDKGVVFIPKQRYNEQVNLCEGFTIKSNLSLLELTNLAKRFSNNHKKSVDGIKFSFSEFWEIHYE